MHHQPIARGIPGISAWGEEIDHHASDRRILLKLVGAQRSNLISLHADFFLWRIQARVRQIDHQAIRIGDRLNRRNHRPRR